MPEQKEAPRPHGDPLEREIVEDNPAQRQSDAASDAVAADRPEAVRKETDVELVSKID